MVAKNTIKWEGLAPCVDKFTVNVEQLAVVTAKAISYLVNTSLGQCVTFYGMKLTDIYKQICLVLDDPTPAVLSVIKFMLNKLREYGYVEVLERSPPKFKLCKDSPLWKLAKTSDKELAELLVKLASS